MKIKRLVIENFKSIERIELVEPNPFTVFVGPNGSGKSNIFEALEYINYSKAIDDSIDEAFGGVDNFINRKSTPDKLFFSFECQFESFISKYTRYYNAETAKNSGLPTIGAQVYENGKLIKIVSAHSSSKNYHSLSQEDLKENSSSEEEYKVFFQKFTRLFIGNEKNEKSNVIVMPAFQYQRLI